MASNYTEHFHLCQWAADDPVLREDFNTDNAKIEAAIHATNSKINEVATSRCRMVVGSYIGDGAATRTIDLGVWPKFIWVWQSGSTFPFANAYDTTAAIAIPGQPAILQGNLAMEILDNGFLVVYSPNLGNNYDIFLNSPDVHYSFLALA